MALGALMAARLAVGLAPPLALPHDLRERRADRAKHWLTTLAMPQPARMALLRAFDASATPNTHAAVTNTADALIELTRTLTGHLDVAAQQELSALANALRDGRIITVAA
jgi:hypothetical protein